MKKTFTTLLIITAIFFIRPASLVAQVNAQDSLALVALYNSTDGAHWKNHTNWLTTAPVSKWHGITLADHRVLFLILPGNNLIGNMPSELSNLVNLQTLDLSFNALTGKVPSSINKLTSLIKLALNNNQLQDAIPVLDDLKKLNALNLQLNKFTFAGLHRIAFGFPFAIYSPQAPVKINQTGNMLSVQTGNDLTLSFTVYKWYKGSMLVATISGDSTFLPSQSGNYSVAATNSFAAPALTLYSDTVFIKPFNNNDSLALVDLYNRTNGVNWINHSNWLTPAPVSTWFGITANKDKVTVIHLPGNRLRGNIPVSIGNLANLQALILDHNKLTDTIPKELGNDTSLQILMLDDNTLSGTIPYSLGKLNLHVLQLNLNELSGIIPSSLINYDVSAGIYLASNSFTFAGLEALVKKFPFISYAPQEIINVNIDSNILSVHAGGANTLAHSKYKWYKGSTLVATITGDSTFEPAESGNYSVAVTNSIAKQLTLYSDTIFYVKTVVNLNDSLALVALYHNTNGAGWIHSNNWLTYAPVSSWYGIKVVNNRVTGINLSENNLYNRLPVEIGNLSELITLDLSSNNLEYEIPVEIGNLSKLITLNLSSNDFRDIIPKQIGNLSNLVTLNLSGDKLRGEIPEEIGNLVNLKNLNLSANLYLKGKIPSSIGNLINLDTLELGADHFSNIPFAIGNLTNLVLLDMHASYLKESIPASIGKLTKLVTLDLANNYLSGQMPSEISNLINLKTLNFYGNQLSGEIPFSFGKLSNLSSLFLLHNNLSGTVPSSLDQLSNTIVVLSNNKFTFAGLGKLVQSNGSNFYYAQQANIPLHKNGNTLSVSAGGPVSNNTYHWYKDDSLVATITRDSTYHPAKSGQYHVTVTNSIATALTLYSDTIGYFKSNNTWDANNILFTEDFERSKIDEKTWLKEAIDTATAITTSTDVARKHGRSAKFNFKFSDWSDADSLLPEGHRVELHPRRGTVPGRLKLDSGYWIGFSYYFPSSWQIDPSATIIFQFHGDANPDSLGGGSRSPALHGAINGNKDFVNIELIDSTNNMFSIGKVPVVKNQWNDWIMHVKFSYTSGYDTVWVNGTRVAAYAGSNFYHVPGQKTNLGPYLKSGIYKGHWGDSGITGQASSLTMYEDAIIIGNNRATYDQINSFFGSTPMPSNQDESSPTGFAEYDATASSLNPNNLVAYPNPATSTAMLSFNAVGKYTITVTDMSGKILQTKTGVAIKGVNTVQLDVSKYAGGMYLITIIDEKSKRQTMRLNKK